MKALKIANDLKALKRLIGVENSDKYVVIEGLCSVN